MKPGEIVGKWTLCKKFKSGGNGEIWLAKGDDETEIAIKFLIKVKPIPYKRFKDEVHALVEYIGTNGIMPILDYSLPAELGTTIPWYAMPVCESVEEHFAEAGPATIVEAFLPLLETLEKLHANGFSHRDIKPANLLFKDDQILFADFGLVDYPDKEDVTGKGDSVGPKWTMAPEMKRNAANADGRPADIYSLAKTLWILLTKETKGFEGQYIPDEYIGINRKSLGIYSKPLDDLLAACTQNDPNKRPTATSLKELLQQWQLLNEDYQKRNPAQWKDIQNDIFPFSTPATAVWYDREDIVRVLNKVGSIKSLNHMFFPTGGGLDLTSARFSNEKDCIEMIADGTVSVVKPKKLTLESFGFDYQWNYFRLEVHDLEKSNVYDEYSENCYREELTEISPAVYADYNCYEYNDLNGEPLPEGARHITRFFKGCFVFFQKTSRYNKTPSTYDATHEKMSETDFRKMIEKAAKSFQKEKSHAEIGADFKIIKSTSWKSYSGTLSKDIIDIIENVIDLAANANKEYERLSKEIGDDFFKWYESERPEERKLEDYLNSLPQDDVVLLEGVMYAGRDYMIGGMVYPLEKYMQKYDEGIVDHICGKAPLAEYLAGGLKMYR